MSESNINKNTGFKLITIGLVILLFLILEVTLRILIPTEKNENFIDVGELQFFSKITIRGEKHIRITSKYGYSQQHITFKEKKSPETYRVICLGGSASAGWPHPDNERFTAYLDTCLQKIYPSKDIEIINCSAHGFASYRVKKVFEQTLAYQPDAVLVWSGNNEFLEEKHFTTSKVQEVIEFLAEKSKTVQVIKNALPKKIMDGNEINVANSFWKKAQQEALELCENPALAKKVREVFEQSLAEITRKAAQNDIKVVLFTVPVNLRDWQPNVSYNSLKGQNFNSWQTVYHKGRSALLNHDFQSARLFLEKAVSLEPLHAMSHFLLAQCFEGINDTISALQSYVRAKDLDYNPFRAVTDFNESIRKIADESPNASLFDAEKIFQNHAINSTPGFDLFLDYVHPTRKGNIILAAELIEQITRSDLFELEISNPAVDISQLDSLLSDYRDENDIDLQVIRFSLCCLTHQYKPALEIGTKILAGLPKMNTNALNPHDLNKIKDGVEVFSRYLDLDMQWLNNKITVHEMKPVQKAMKDFYHTYYPYGNY